MRMAAILVALGLGLTGCYPEKNCELACQHVLDCQADGYDDSDLRRTSLEACVAACRDDTTLNWCFDDCSSAEIQVRWQCATARTSCSDLDHECDVY